MFIEWAIEVTCQSKGWWVRALAVQPDHVHIVVSAPLKVAPMVIARTLKSTTAMGAFQRFPQLRRQFSNGFWSRGTYYGSVGNIGQDVVQDYVNRQS